MKNNKTEHVFKHENQTFRINFSEPDDAYLVTVDGYPGLMAHGASPQEAEQEAIVMWEGAKQMLAERHDSKKVIVVVMMREKLGCKDIHIEPFDPKSPNLLKFLGSLNVFGENSLEDMAKIIIPPYKPEQSHKGHGSGTEEDGPDDCDCPCRTTAEHKDFAVEGCGFCEAQERRDSDA